MVFRRNFLVVDGGVGEEWKLVGRWKPGMGRGVRGCEEVRRMIEACRLPLNLIGNSVLGLRGLHSFVGVEQHTDPSRSHFAAGNYCS